MSDKTIKEYEIFNITEIEGWETCRVNNLKKKRFFTYAYIFLEEHLSFFKYLNF